MSGATSQPKRHQSLGPYPGVADFFTADITSVAGTLHTLIDETVPAIDTGGWILVLAEVGTPHLGEIRVLLGTVLIGRSFGSPSNTNLFLNWPAGRPIAVETRVRVQYRQCIGSPVPVNSNLHITRLK